VVLVLVLAAAVVVLVWAVVVMGCPWSWCCGWVVWAEWWWRSLLLVVGRLGLRGGGGGGVGGRVRGVGRLGRGIAPRLAVERVRIL
jgi:hypothetical protein